MENQTQIHKQVHDLVSDFSEKMMIKIQEFTLIQSELMEFRIFASLFKNDKETYEILKFHNKNKNERWESLVKKFKGNEEKAIESYYK